MAVRGKQKDEDRRHQDALGLAWHFVALGRTRRLPSLKRLLGIKPRELTPAEMDAAREAHEEAMRLTEAGGG